VVRAFLKAGILTELGDFQDTDTGTPQGGILSPLLANIALSVLDEHLHAPWKPGGSMFTAYQRRSRRCKDLPNWRLVRYADDFVVLTDGSKHHLRELREQITRVLEPLGLRLSEAKTRMVHMSEGFDLLGFRIQWKRKRGTNKWHVYTFIADRPLRSVKTKIRALTPRTSQQDLRAVLIQINQLTRGWANYFKHAVAKRTFSRLQKLHLVADRADDADPAPLEVEGRPSLAHRPRNGPVATDQRGRDRTVQPRDDTHHQVPLPGQPDPQPLGPGCLNQPTAETMESPLR
jgi:RNA-directed DNA polymerase